MERILKYLSNKVSITEEKGSMIELVWNSNE